MSRFFMFFLSSVLILPKCLPSFEEGRPIWHKHLIPNILNNSRHCAKGFSVALSWTLKCPVIEPPCAFRRQCRSFGAPPFLIGYVLRHRFVLPFFNVTKRQRTHTPAHYSTVRFLTQAPLHLTHCFYIHFLAHPSIGRLSLCKVLDMAAGHAMITIRYFGNIFSPHIGMLLS